MASERLPKKILKPLGGTEPMLVWVVERARRSKEAEEVIVATTDHPRDDCVVDLCRRYGYPYFRGSETDVLKRYLLCAETYTLDTIVRITADCPFIASEIIDRSLNIFHQTGCDYVNNTRFQKTFPRGLDVEVLSREVLAKIDRLAKKEAEREHVTLYIYDHPREFSIVTLEADSDYHAPELRLTVDTNTDFKFASRVAEEFQSDGICVDTKKIIHFLKIHPDIVAINKNVLQKAIEGRII